MTVPRFAAPQSLQELTHQPHFIYQADTPGDPLDLKAAAKTLSNLVHRHIRKVGISALSIDVLASSDIQCNGSQKEKLAYERLVSHLNLENASLVYCTSASIHNDPLFENKAFVSFVISTGSGKNDGPYLLDVVGQVNPEDEIKTSSLAINAFDMFVFDPSAGHCAFALEPSRTSLLILLQSEIQDDASDQRRSEIMEQFVPKSVFMNKNDYL